LLAVLLFFVPFIKEKKKKSTILNLRKQRGSSSQIKALKMRSSDSNSLADKRQKQKSKADELIAKGKIIEGAKILEGIGLPRFAISALEQSGYIDEACEVLRKMGRPNRAGAIYMRNGMFLKAAKQYLVAGMNYDAAKCYMLAAKTNPEYYVAAGEIYEHNYDWNNALICYELAGHNDMVLKLCIQHELWSQLRDFLLRAPEGSQVVSIVNEDIFSKLMQALPLENNTLKCLMKIVNSSKNNLFAEKVLVELKAEIKNYHNFWSGLQSKFLSKFLDYLLNNPNYTPQSESHCLRFSARALYELEIYDAAASVYEKLERSSMAGKSYLLSGNIDKGLLFLERNLEESMILEVRKELESGCVSNELTEQCIANLKEILKNINPEKDEHHSKSPFSISA